MSIDIDTLPGLAYKSELVLLDSWDRDCPIIITKTLEGAQLLAYEGFPSLTAEQARSLAKEEKFKNLRLRLAPGVKGRFGPAKEIRNLQIDGFTGFVDAYQADPDGFKALIEAGINWAEPAESRAGPARTASTPEADNVGKVEAAPWPDPPALEAFHGLAGDIIRAIEPHTEADPAGLLVQFLAAFGSVIGRNAFFMAEADQHFLNLFGVMVGSTSKGRKGTSWGHIRRLFEAVDPTWADTRIQSGLSSGEGLIWAVRDPIEKTEPIREGGKQTGQYQQVITDTGIEDKRLLAQESEFASTLRVLGREGNTLSPIIRQAWDTGSLRSLTKNSPARATGAHISIIGHITKDELRRYLDGTEAGNGFGNRFLWVCVRRSKVLPRGGSIRKVDFAPMVRRLKEAVEFARNVGEIQPDEEAWCIWDRVYESLSEGKPGLLGAVISRAESQVMRIACIYAVLDLSPVIRREHLLAALAIWGYAETSAHFIFGGSLGDPVADKILEALRHKAEGLTRTAIRDLFDRHRPSHEINAALTTLLESGRVRREERDTEGRPVQWWFSVGGLATKAT